MDSIVIICIISIIVYIILLIYLFISLVCIICSISMSIYLYKYISIYIMMSGLVNECSIIYIHIGIGLVHKVISRSILCINLWLC